MTTDAGNLKNFHVIEIHYLPSTQKIPARLKLISGRFKQKLLIDNDYISNYWWESAVKFLLDRKFNIIGQSELETGMAIISDTFEPIYESKS